MLIYLVISLLTRVCSWPPNILWQLTPQPNDVLCAKTMTKGKEHQKLELIKGLNNGGISCMKPLKICLFNSRFDHNSALTLIFMLVWYCHFEVRSKLGQNTSKGRQYLMFLIKKTQIYS